MFRHHRNSRPTSRRPQPRLHLERLEDRTVPTTTAALSNGVLTITGDAGNNNVIITEQATPGSYQVAAPDLAGSPLSFTGVRSISAQTGAGTDSLTFNGSATAGTRLSGGLDVSGTGALTVDLNANVNVGGTVTVNHSGTGVLDLSVTGAGASIGNLLVFNGDGDSTIDLTAAARVLGFTSLNLAGGNNTVTLANVRLDSFLSVVGTTGNDVLNLTAGTRVGQNIFLDAAAGANQFVVSDAVIAGTLNFSTAGAGEIFSVQNSAVVQGTATVRKTADTGLLNVTVTSGSRLGGDLRVIAAGGDELVQITATVAGNLDVSLAAGLNTVVINGGGVSNLLHFGTGTETITLQNAARIRGFVSVNAGSAVDVDVDVNDSALQTFLSVVSGGGNDTVDLVNADINANLAFVLGAAQDVVTFNNVSVFGTSLLDLGAGDDLVNVERGTAADNAGTTFFGAFTFRGGDGGDRLNLGQAATDTALFLATATVDGQGNAAATVDILDRAFAEFAGPRPNVTNVLLTPLTVFAVTSTNLLVSFEGTAPAVLTSSVPITGMQVGEQAVAIDFRPATGQLFALGSTGRVYTLDVMTGAATQVNTTTLTGADVGFDFNPVPDALRIVSDSDQNLRLTGGGSGTVTTDTGLAFATGDANAAANANIVAAAYTNNFAGATSTTLYGIDSNLDVLVTQNPPNNGTLNTVGPLGVNTSDLAGFDITDGNAAYAVLNVGGTSQFYLINLTTGAAKLVGNVGVGITVVGIAIPAPSGF